MNREKNFEDFLQQLGFRESSGSYANNKNPLYKGKYQMGESALEDSGYYKKGTSNVAWGGEFSGKDGVYSLNDFLNNPKAQDNAIKEYMKKQWQYIKGNDLDKYVGKNINGIKVTPSGLLAAAHLVGAYGAKPFFDSNGKIMPKDGNGTTLQEYLEKFSDYNMQDITGPILTPYTYNLYDKIFKKQDSYSYSDFFPSKKLQEIKSSPTGYGANINDIFYSNEDINEMTSEEFSNVKDIINNQIKNKMAISRKEAQAGVNSGAFVWVDDYQRDDGTKVKGYYRRK